MPGEILSAKQAAKILGVSPQCVRERIKRGIWTFGEMIPKEKTGNKILIVYTGKNYIDTLAMSQRKGGQSIETSNRCILSTGRGRISRIRYDLGAGGADRLRRCHGVKEKGTFQPASKRRCT